jgi:hypothetical protein
MPKFRVKLVTTVEVGASCDIEVEAENEAEANDKALDVYADLEEKQEKALKLYHDGKGEYPSAPFYWSVDSDDVEGAVDSSAIDIDEVEQVEA